MAKKGGYIIENVYQGGYSTLDPNKAYSSSFTGYRANVGSLGITTNPGTINQIKEVSDKLASGLKNVEIEFIEPRVMDAIPKQQLTEIRQLSKLVGGDVSVHGPVIDSTGMGEQGFSELNRELAERKITEALLRSHELKPDGNITVNFHSAQGIPSSTWKTLGDVEGKKPREFKRMVAVERETGKMIHLDTEKKYYPGEDLSKGETYTPERNLESLNATSWDNQLTQLFFNKERADQILGENGAMIQDVLGSIEEIKKKGLNPYEVLSKPQQNALARYYDAQRYLEEINRQARSIFSKGYEFGNDKQKRELAKISEQYKEDIQKAGIDPLAQSMAIRSLLNELQNPKLAPEMFVPIEEFATEQSAKTFGNAAFNAFDKFKDPNKTPITLIENPPAGFGLSTGEDLRNLVVESRKKFVEKAVKEKNMSEKEAEKIAEKLIGATWDVGHINMLRKEGFKEQDIIRETEKIAPYVKHIHLSDNFGFEHTELPMGMGNVPMKEIMEKLGEKGFEAKKIIEAGDWWTGMKTSPVKEALEGLGSPMYMTGPGPYWNQSIGLQQNYLSGYGMMLPSNNYQIFGAGFSQLPQDLGGDMKSSGGRFSQRGME
ncbi:MAG TPA: sugar phosphate isomerase/epimerase [Candidatus Pacearchaeota archaeon]|nr:sugar phosphate isomerase/epimerase [Candidatus Pacearchaeota archaeon]HOR52061.1 sugar phosphate isomerase/epimerase [Candidatus Pacearchaeota archaeon]HOU79013.1 sugar phosphate isomerase/epimerase [Candidatus Pacearchaeota archaeon]HPJ87270.1 sugar phosphate isomerase/epimerase [Candidatus Pacearchaeota archaeon]HQF82725.1 sugar phosphate isomerase/epimerase [Candidatus Pacearchaeota archaeon]